MNRDFSDYDMIFERRGRGSWVSATGEITNSSNRNYNTAMFRLTLFGKDMLMWTGIFKIRDFRKGQTRPFEVLLENFNYKSVPYISKHEICFESGY